MILEVETVTRAWTQGSDSGVAQLPFERREVGYEFPRTPDSTSGCSDSGHSPQDKGLEFPLFSLLILRARLS